MTSKRWVDWTLIALCVSLSLLTLALNFGSPVARALRRGERINGIVLGSDYEDNARHSDTIMLVSYDPNRRFLDVLSIPRDTQVSFPGLPHIHRINEIFTYEFRHSGKSFRSATLAVKSVVESLLSSGTVQGIDIPYYFTIDYGGFRNLIDAMGGVNVRVTEPMNYDDNWGHLHIHFDPGMHWMNGHEALQYVRYRGGGNADQGRVLRQQIFVKEVLKRLKNPTILFRLPHYGSVLLAGFHTNFTPWDLFSLLMEGCRMNWSNIRLFSLPGQIVGQLWRMSPDDARRVLALMQAPPPETRGQPTVEVWNGSGRSNGARYVVDLLREKGFDVVRFGNYPAQRRTLVLDRSGRLRPAQSVAKVLSAVSPEVVSRVDLERQVDVSVILGSDYVPPPAEKLRL